MKASQFLLATLKESPADAQTISHKLMLRSGMIRQLGSGLYHWLPLGLKVMRKVEAIVREEMSRIDCLEMLMPVVHPADIWQESGRWEDFGPELLKITDRHGRDACIAPTHEDAITSLMRNELKSYKQLPATFYQIQTKFRDETRPRAGIMRAREFIMKDAYSFHADTESLNKTYEKFFDAYHVIFKRLGVEFRAALADTGSIGGDLSHEFHVIAESGEDKIAISNESNYIANIELAESVTAVERPAATAEMKLVDTPDKRTIKDVCEFLGATHDTSIKALFVKGSDEEKPLIALMLRGDHELNELKAEKHPLIFSPLTFADEEDIAKAMKCPIGYLGPVNTDIPVIADRHAAVMSDFSCGANQEGKHFINVNWVRDCAEPEVFDLRLVQEGDASPDGKGTLKFTRGIEVGHIFQLGDIYSKKMSANVLNENGKSIPMQMGCYGLGISRVVAAAIEQHHDEKGITWPASLAPFDIALIPINMKKSQRLQLAAQALYEKLQTLGYDVFFDDRKERAGVMFTDAELIGIPHRLVISDKGLDTNEIEYKHRKDADSTNISLEELEGFLKERRE
jgi:prolyl-tRNA synthetase